MNISVVIPCYNCENTISETIDSILSQGDGEVEIVCVNDGSKDGTAKVLANYADHITYVEQDNAGVSSARNNGVSKASRDWVAFCDADDIWHKDKLKYLKRAIIEIPGIDFIFHDFYILLDNKVLAPRATHSRHTFFPIFLQWNVSIPQILINHKKIVMPEEGLEWPEMDVHCGNAFKWLILGNFILPSSVTMRRDTFLRENGFSDEFTTGEDTEFFLRIAKNVDFLYIDQPLVGYRRTSTSLLSSSMLRTMENGINSVLKNCVEDAEIYSKYGSIVKKSLARRHARLGYYLLSESDNNAAFSSSLKSLKYNKLESLAWIVLVFSILPKTVLSGIRNLKDRFK